MWLVGWPIHPQLMAETIEKERGKGGAEAMLRAASLEEQMRQVGPPGRQAGTGEGGTDAP